MMNKKKKSFALNQIERKTNGNFHKAQPNKWNNYKN